MALSTQIVKAELLRSDSRDITHPIRQQRHLNNKGMPPPIR